MTKNNRDIKMNPPYVAFSTLKRFIETLHKTAVPGRIDRSVLPKMSGVTQSQLTSALKFLGLVGPDGTTKADLHALVKSYGTEQWAEQLGDIVSMSYVSIVGDLDLDSGTAKELSDAFRSRGRVEGQLLMKAIRFYLKALAESQLEVSLHFKPPSLHASAIAKNKTKKPKDKSSKATDDYTTKPHSRDESLAKGMTLHPIGGGRHIGLESDLTSEDVDIIESMIPAFRKMAERIKKGGAS